MTELSFRFTKYHAALLTAFLVLGVTFLLPRVDVSTYTLHILILAMVWALFAVGWNLAAGFGGIKAFGHQAFFAIGAYGSALLALHLGWSPWLTIWVAAGLAALASLVVVAPVLRLRSAPQIAIVTLAFGEIARILIINLKDLTKGETGLIGIPPLPNVSVPLLGQISFSASDKWGYFLVISTLLMLTVLANFLFSRSRYGLATVAIRDAQDAAESLGLNATFYRVALFAASAFIVGVAGAFYSHYLLILTPEDSSSVVMMIMIVSMTIIGGMGTVLGPVLGALFLAVGLELFRAFEDYRLLIYGLLVVLTIRMMPQGLIHSLLSLCRKIPFR